MKSFFVRSIRFILIGAIPFLLITGTLYLVLDPFKVIYQYDTLVKSGAKSAVVLNKDFISTKTFITNSQKLSYNSFILGNSRSIFYQVDDWKKHLAPDAVCYHFDASGESLAALTKKVEFIDKRGNKIDNMLLLLDYSVLLQDEPRQNHMGIISPALVDNSNIVQFHYVFFTAFLSPRFLYAFLDYTISGELKPYMIEKHLLDDKQRTYDVLTNEMRFEHYEKLIRENKFYTPERLKVFYKRDSTKQEYYPKCINKNQNAMLSSIESIVKKHHTKIKVIINPLYNQTKLNKEDLAYLKNLFGKENVFDFSGINRYTNDYRNYYEDSHYRPTVAKEILDIIYDPNKYWTDSILINNQ